MRRGMRRVRMSDRVGEERRIVEEKYKKRRKYR